MMRIFPDYAYGNAPRDGCWWDETIAAPTWPEQTGDLTADVVVIGGGFTGLSAALHLAQAGVAVTVLEAGTPGWGASGRNGGFCCLGGSKLTRASMIRRYGLAAAEAYEDAEAEAVSLVAELLSRYQIDADVHSRGETLLAHTARAMERLRRESESPVILHEKADLPEMGLGDQFHGGCTHPTGFGLNPRKYLFGLVNAAVAQGVSLFQNSAARHIQRKSGGFEVQTPKGRVRADSVLICTNGYSSEDMPAWMAARYMPTQSSVMVTRPLSDSELVAQGWTSEQICYDTRNLLHYFRLMPDRRFLFGMRGGLMSSPSAEAGIRGKLHKDFRRMFPNWASIEVTNTWSGMVCLSRKLVPYVGGVPGQAGMFAAFAYHGNGVAMGTYCGRALARKVLGQATELPAPIADIPRRIPLGRWRRALMPPAYAFLALQDI